MTLPLTADAPFFFADGLRAQPTQLWVAILTVLVETPLFYLCGYRRRAEWLWFAAVNIISNLLLNEALSEIDAANYAICAAFGEALVVALEAALCAYVVRDNYARLFRTLLLTNAASLCVGFIWAACLEG